MAVDGSSQFFAGVPIAVDPEKIDRELSRLWKPAEAAAESSSAVTRVCLSNVIFYLPDAPSCERARDLLPAVGRRFPSRMILLTRGNGSVSSAKLSASITAVCHVASPGAPPVCCEQITLEASGGSLDVFPGAVVPLLVPDVPVSLVVLCDGGDDIARLLSTVVDKVVFDSRRLAVQALRRVREALRSREACGADDLAWRATIAWRRVICDIFDDPVARAILQKLQTVEVKHQPGSTALAALIAGWLIARLGRDLRVVLVAEGNPGKDPGQVLSVRLTTGREAGAAFLAVSRLEGSSLLKIEYHTEDTCVIPTTVPFREETDADLLGGALEHTTHQDVLRGAVEAACRLG